MVTNKRIEEELCKVSKEQHDGTTTKHASASAPMPTLGSDRGVAVGVCVLVESSDGRVLMTRRASHMRTFPGVWVPPGGHVGKCIYSCTTI